MRRWTISKTGDWEDDQIRGDRLDGVVEVVEAEPVLEALREIRRCASYDNAVGQLRKVDGIAADLLAQLKPS